MATGVRMRIINLIKKKQLDFMIYYLMIILMIILVLIRILDLIMIEMIFRNNMRTINQDRKKEYQRMKIKKEVEIKTLINIKGI